MSLRSAALLVVCVLLGVVTSDGFTVIKMKIPTDMVGAVIGRQGQIIKKVCPIFSVVYITHTVVAQSINTPSPRASCGQF